MRNAATIRVCSDRYSALQSEVQRLKDKELGYQSEAQRLQQSVISLEKSKANAELELKTVEMKLDQEILQHKGTVAEFHADKKNILVSTEEANMEAMKGACSYM